MTRKIGWGVMTLLAMGVSAYALANTLVPGVRSPFVEALFTEKVLRSFVHLGAGGVALAVGALQFSTTLRFQRASVHRLLGKVYLAAVLTSGVAAVLLAPVSSGGAPAHFGFGMLGVLWVGTALVAYTSVRASDYAAHRAWMIRSYALCLAAVTLRIYLGVAGVAGIPFESSYPAIAWLCWVPNLVVAEWVVLGSSVAPLEPSESA